MRWITIAFSEHQPLSKTLIVSFIVFFYNSLIFSLPFIFYVLIRGIFSKRIFSYFGFIVSWITIEHLQQKIELSNPWLILGSGFSTFHQIIQWYEFTGVLGGSAWILIVNILTLELIITFKTGRGIRPIPVFLFTVVPVLLSLYLYSSKIQPTKSCNVLIVQPNIKSDDPNDNETVDKVVDKLFSFSGEARQADYYVFPETAISKYILENSVDQDKLVVAIRRRLKRHPNRIVITGALTGRLYTHQESESSRFDKNTGFYSDHFNSAIQIDANKTRVYHKVKLVPGVEAIPYRNLLGFLKPLFSFFRGSPWGYGKSQSSKIFTSEDGKKVSPVICYESAWSEYVAQCVNTGGQFITVMTNDMWLGNSIGKDQHLEFAKLRAIENRRFVVCAANTGISCFINMKGDVLQRTVWGKRAVLQGRIKLKNQRSFYTINHSLLGNLSTLSTLIVLILIFSMRIKGVFAKFFFRRVSTHSLTFFLFLFVLTGSSCTSTVSLEDANSEDTLVPKINYDTTKVGVEEIRLGQFDLEIISNGRLSALRNAEIKFPTDEVIEQIYVKNGSNVRIGQRLAELNATQLKNRLNRSKDAFEKARIEFDDRLIDYGYRLKDSAHIPSDILHMAKVKSGYNNAKYDYIETLNAFRRTTITAPFSGRIANLEAREYNAAETFRRLCTVIDDSEMLIDFNVLEAELNFIHIGGAIEVIPYGIKSSVKGVVSAINPVIDENGMIKVTGLIRNPSGLLLNGMNVKVIVKKSLTNKLCVPKSALLQRQDREVVFTYEKGKAKWNYVEAGLQNSKYVIINSGLKAGQIVITQNNFNLANDVAVQVDNDAATRE